ncbi:MAG: hypothetical protein L0Z46_12680 [Nitrospiraceae bacterium]|nr:hypothetical protein [Nitrospiraceae bacterium]
MRKAKILISHPAQWDISPTNILVEANDDCTVTLFDLDDIQSPPSEFERQKAAFLAIPPLFLAQYQGQFAVSRNGEIVDHDYDLPTLTDRFFAQNPNASVYISRIGNAVPEVIATPFDL